MSPALDECDRIRAVMDRIMAGATEHSNGALTIMALAVEAGVPRNALTQRHLDLKNEFYAKVKERGQPTDAEVRLRKRIVKLKELRERDQTELIELRADQEALVRIVNQLTLENRRLRQQLAPSSVSCPPSPVHLVTDHGREWLMGLKCPVTRHLCWRAAPDRSTRTGLKRILFQQCEVLSPSVVTLHRSG